MTSPRADPALFLPPPPSSSLLPPHSPSPLLSSPPPPSSPSSPYTLRSNPHTHRHVDAVELCFHSFLEDIERTRPRYPGERARRSGSPQPPAHAPLAASSSSAAADTGARGKARDVSKLERERPLEGEDAVQRWDGERRDVEVRQSGEGY